MRTQGLKDKTYRYLELVTVERFFTCKGVNHFHYILPEFNRL